MGINQFADWTFTEFSKMFTPNETITAKVKDKAKDLLEAFQPKVIYRFGLKNKLIPSSFDWRNRGAVTKVKDQKTCGSCYAMATVAAIESQLFIRTGKLIELSEQEIVDCAGDAYNSFQCAGGVAFKVFDYVKDKGGLSSMEDYPYDNDAKECRLPEKKVDIRVKGYGYVSSGDDSILMRAVSEVGPIVVSLDIDNESFMRYSSGIYVGINCTKLVNHGALLVGFGTENGIDYWIVKNSFGETWGESGFFRIARGEEKDCSIDVIPIYPILHEDKKDKLPNLNNFNFSEKSFMDFAAKFRTLALEKN